MMQVTWLLLVFLIGVLLFIGCALLALRTLNTPIYLPDSNRPLTHLLMAHPLRVMPLDAPLAQPTTVASSDGGWSVQSFDCLRAVSGKWACLGAIRNDGEHDRTSPFIRLQTSDEHDAIARHLPLVPVIGAGAQAPFRILFGADAITDGTVLDVSVDAGVEAHHAQSLAPPEWILGRIDAQGRYEIDYQLMPYDGRMGVAIWLTTPTGQVVGYRQQDHISAQTDGVRWHRLIVTPYFIADDLEVHISAWRIISPE